MANAFRVGFCVSGAGRLCRAAIAQREHLGIQPALVVAEQTAASDLEEFCARHSVPFVRLEKLNRPEFDRQVTQICTEAQLNLLCLTFDKIIPRELVQFYHQRIINVHPGLLPAFRGMGPLQSALDAGVRFVGATVHEVDELVDHGAIIAQCIAGVRAQDTVHTLGARLFGQLRLMFLQVITWYSADRVMHDAQGRIWIRDAVYGELPISPALEQGFPD